MCVCVCVCVCVVCACVCACVCVCVLNSFILWLRNTNISVNSNKPGIPSPLSSLPLINTEQCVYPEKGHTITLLHKFVLAKTWDFLGLN